VRTQLDGSSPTVWTGLNNPNGIAIIGTKIYVTDSNYKTRIPRNARTAKDGSLYSMDINAGQGTAWTDVLESVATKLKVNGGHQSFTTLVHVLLHVYEQTNSLHLMLAVIKL